MTRDLHPALEAQSRAPSIAPILLVRVDTASGPNRMWTGYGTLQWGGHEWTGGGELLGISAVKETLDLAAEGMSFSLSGIPIDLLRTVLEETRQGLPAEMWFAAMDDQGRIIGEPALLFRGLTDTALVAEDGVTCTVAVTAESRLIDLERARVRRYTDDDQKIDHPTDRGFEYVPALQEVEITFGRL